MPHILLQRPLLERFPRWKQGAGLLDDEEHGMSMKKRMRSGAGAR